MEMQTSMEMQYTT